jgi:hypothetical protein
VFSAEAASPEEFFARYFERFDIQVAGEWYRAWHGDAYDPLFLGNFGLPSSALMHAGFFRQLGGFRDDLRLAEETEFFHRAAAAAEVVLVDAPLVSYRRGMDGSLISGANAARLSHNALESLDSAAALRPERSARAAANWRLGRQRLLERLASTQLSNLEATAAREQFRAAWAAGAPRSLKSMALYGATFLPMPVLRQLGRLKRMARG